MRFELKKASQVQIVNRPRRKKYRSFKGGLCKQTDEAQEISFHIHLYGTNQNTERISTISVQKPKEQPYCSKAAQIVPRCKFLQSGEDVWSDGSVCFSDFRKRRDFCLSGFVLFHLAALSYIIVLLACKYYGQPPAKFR